MQEHCCGADQLFSLKDAEKERKRYLKKGPKSSTAAIIVQLSGEVRLGERLLDIGGGIGVLGMELRKNGLAQYTSVDASSGYQRVASEMLESSSSESFRARFLQGDFVELADQLETHEYVTLDKVICCYPQMEELLRAASEKCSSQIALSYPPSGLIAKMLRALGNTYFRLRGNPFRTYLHPKKEVHRILTNQGFKQVSKSQRFPWKIEIWQRN